MRLIRKATYAFIFVLFAVWSKYLIKKYGFKVLLEKLEKQNIFFHFKNLEHKNVINSLLHSSELISKKLGLKCLTKSISNYFCLVALGAKPKLSIGVKFNSKSNFESHAWISVDNYVFFEDPRSLQDFTIIREV